MVIEKEQYRENTGMKKRFMWKRVIALVLAVLMLPISDFAECFSITAYAATSELISESQETYAAEADANLEVPDENDGEVHTQDNGCMVSGIIQAKLKKAGQPVDSSLGAGFIF